VNLFASGSCESLKCRYHAALGLLALGAAVYNAVALTQRSDAHLKINVLVYTALTALEVRKVMHHAVNE
jgi:hypothetical protein